MTVGDYIDVQQEKKRFPVLTIDRHDFAQAGSPTLAYMLLQSIRENFIRQCINFALANCGRILPGESIGIETGYMTPNGTGSIIYNFPETR